MNARNIIAVNSKGKTLFSMPCSPDPTSTALKVFNHACDSRGIKNYETLIEVAA